MPEIKTALRPPRSDAVAATGPLAPAARPAPAFVPTTSPDSAAAWVFGAVTVLVIGFALRALGFPDLPPGFHFDEGFNGVDALAVVNGDRPLFFTGNNGREPFFLYLQALTTAALGPGVFAVRIPALFVGTLTVALTIPLARVWLRALGLPECGWRWGALAAGFFLATLLWHVHFSRFGFRAISLPFFLAAGLYFFWRGAETRRPVWFALAGVACGGATYTYLSARLLPVLMAILCCAVWLALTGERRRVSLGLGGFWLAYGLVSAPLAIYFLLNREVALGHTTDLAIWSSGPGPLIDNAARLAGMFFWTGDHNWRHNLSGRPAFDLVTAVLSVAGLGWVLWRCFRPDSAPSADRRLVRPAAIALFIWPAIFVVPSLLSEGAPHFLRAIGVLPDIVLFSAIGAVVLARVRVGTVVARRLATVAVAGVVVILTASAYFGQYASSIPAYHIFHGHLLDVSRAAAAVAPNQRLLLDSELGRHTAVQLVLRDRGFLTIDGNRLLALPPEPALFVVPAAAPGDLVDEVLAGLPREPLPDRAGDIAFHAIRWPGAAGHSFPSDLVAPRAAPGGPAGPAQFAGGPRLQGILPRTTDSAIAPGGTYSVTLLWTGRPAGGEGLHQSLRLLDSEGRTWAQADERMGIPDFPATEWPDRLPVATRAPLVIPADVPPGRYRLALGVYDYPSGRTLPARWAANAEAPAVDLGGLVVNRPAPGAAATFAPARPLDASVAGLRLLGVTPEPAEAWTSGPLALRVFWQVEQPPARNLALRIVWSAMDGRAIGRTEKQPFDGVYPAERWQTGDALNDRLTMMPADAVPAGPTTLTIEWLDAESGGTLGSHTVAGPVAQGRPVHLTAPASLDVALDSPFGDFARLAGVDLPGSPRLPDATGDLPRFTLPADSLTVELVWQALQPAAANYRVFVHLAGPDLRPLAQHDGEPAGGDAPTRDWLPGEYLRDAHTLSVAGIPRDVELTLLAGLYDPATGQRVPAADGRDFVAIARFVAGAASE